MDASTDCQAVNYSVLVVDMCTKRTGAECNDKWFLMIPFLIIFNTFNGFIFLFSYFQICAI